VGRVAFGLKDTSEKVGFLKKLRPPERSEARDYLFQWCVARAQSKDLALQAESAADPESAA
jgi:hypothetical protein